MIRIFGIPSADLLYTLRYLLLVVSLIYNIPKDVDLIQLIFILSHSTLPLQWSVYLLTLELYMFSNWTETPQKNQILWEVLLTRS